MSLTPRQKEVFDFVQSFLAEKGYPPTHAELMQHFRWKSPGTVQDLLKALVRRGYLQKDWKTANSLKITKNNLPLLGRVAAGRPLEYHIADEAMEVPSFILRKGGDFILQVEGDSMVDEGILDGDFVIIKKTNAAESGQIVVASLEGAATIKTFFNQNGRIELHSANPKYQPILVEANQDFRIEGTFCGLMRV